MFIRPLFMFFTPIPSTEEYNNHKDLIKDKKLEELHPYLFPFAGKTYSVKDMEDLLTLQISIHPLERIEYLDDDSNIKQYILDHLIKNKKLRKFSIQNILYSSMEQKEIKSIKTYLKNINTDIVHYYIKDFEKFQQDYQADSVIEKQWNNHELFKSFVKELKTNNIKIKSEYDKNTKIDLFTPLYLTKSELSKYLGDLPDKIILRFWSNKRKISNKLKAKGIPEIIPKFSKDKVKELFENHNYKINQINEIGEFIDIFAISNSLNRGLPYI
jgi:hypothetical protein